MKATELSYEQMMEMRAKYAKRHQDFMSRAHISVNSLATEYNIAARRVREILRAQAPELEGEEPLLITQGRTARMGADTIERAREMYHSQGASLMQVYEAVFKGVHSVTMKELAAIVTGEKYADYPGPVGPLREPIRPIQKRLTREQRRRMVEQYMRMGVTVNEIADAENVSRTTVWRVLKSADADEEQ